MAVEKKMIQIDRSVAEDVKAMYPDLSWNSIVGLLLTKDSSKDNTKDSPPISTYATMDDLKELKDKFSLVLTQLIDMNKLKQ